MTYTEGENEGGVYDGEWWNSLRDTTEGTGIQTDENLTGKHTLRSLLELIS